jgi:hypothetical protein
MAGIFHNPAPGLNFLALIRGRGPPANGRINVAAALGAATACLNFRGARCNDPQPISET